MPSTDADNSFPIHGGTCTVVTPSTDGLPEVDDADVPEDALVVDVGGERPETLVRIEQTVFRHLHWLLVLFALGAVAAAVVTALADWQYVTGTGRPVRAVEWLALGLAAFRDADLQVDVDESARELLPAEN